MRTPLASLALLTLLALACGGAPLEPTPAGPSTTPKLGEALPTPLPQGQPMEQIPAGAEQPPGVWPAQSNAVWPTGCLIENATLHPSQPWLAVACTEAEGETGAVMVFDLRAGTLRNAIVLQGYAGWSGSEFLSWHPDGTQLVSNVDTNGVLVLKDAKPLGRIFPDETRDSGVGTLWVGEQLYTDTGHLVQVKEGDARFDFEYKEGPPGYQHMRWNAETRTVVGWEQSSFVAYDPVTETRRVELAILPRSVHLGCSTDGRWCAGRQVRPHPAPDALVLVNATKGELLPLVLLSSTHFRDMAWGPSGEMATSSYTHTVGGPRSDFVVDIWEQGALRTSIALGDRQPSIGFAIWELGGMAWSPDAQSLAVLLEDQDVLVFGTEKGEQRGHFSAPSAPVPPALPDWYGSGKREPGAYHGSLAWGSAERIVRVGGHYVSIWTPQGQKVAEFIVPTAL